MDATATQSPSTVAPTRHDQLTHQARRLVSQVFFGTLLKQAHESPFKSKLFSGGRGGEAFSSMLDQRMADRMANGPGRRIADALVRHIERAPKNAPAALPGIKSPSMPANPMPTIPSPMRRAHSDGVLNGILA